MSALTSPAVNGQGHEHMDETAMLAAELRGLIDDLKSAAADGRFLARKQAELLTQAVDEYCGQFERRAESVLARLEAIQSE